MSDLIKIIVNNNQSGSSILLISQEEARQFCQQIVDMVGCDSLDSAYLERDFYKLRVEKLELASRVNIDNGRTVTCGACGEVALQVCTHLAEKMMLHAVAAAKCEWLLGLIQEALEAVEDWQDLHHEKYGTPPPGGRQLLYRLRAALEGR